MFGENWQDKLIQRGTQQRNAINKSFTDNDIEKGKEVPIGTISMHGGKKMKKVGPKKWIPAPEKGGSGEKHSHDKLKALTVNKIRVIADSLDVPTKGNTGEPRGKMTLIQAILSKQNKSTAGSGKDPKEGDQGHLKTVGDYTIKHNSESEMYEVIGKNGEMISEHRTPEMAVERAKRQQSRDSKNEPKSGDDKAAKVKAIISGKGSKSQKARDLHDLGMKTSSIAKHLDMHYSHAHTVVKKHKDSGKVKTSDKKDEVETSEKEEAIGKIETLIKTGASTNIILALALAKSQKINVNEIEYVANLNDFYDQVSGPRANRDFRVSAKLKKVKSLEKRIEALDTPIGFVGGDDMTTVPKGIGSAKGIEHLFLGNTQIKSIPLEVADLPNLQTLEVPKGTSVPDKVKNMPNLKFRYY